MNSNFSQSDFSSSGTDRQTIPDWIKGIAITLMVYGHVTHIGTASHLQHNLVVGIYTFHMPLFLIISGFFLNLNGDIFKATYKVCRRILVPYLFFSSLYLLGLIFIQQVGIHTNNAPPMSITGFFETLFIHPRGGYWFLHSLIILQLCMLFSRCLLTRFKHEVPLVVFYICLIALTCQFDLLLSKTAIYFLLGLILRQFTNFIPASFFLGLLLTLLMVFIGMGNLEILSFMQVALVMSVMLFLAGLGLICNKLALFSMFVWIGRNSLIILCLHTIFVVLFKPLANVFLWIDASGIMYSTSITLIAVSGSILGAKALDILHSSKILFGVEKLYVKWM